jgi:hypothetical protein
MELPGPRVDLVVARAHPIHFGPAPRARSNKEDSVSQAIATPTSEQAAGKATIRPFQVPTVPEAELADLRRRIEATRFPDRETVTDATQGVQLATVEKLARYWATQYDWRKCEARLQALPHFITEIDGLDIHFIHVRSKHETRCR